MPPFCETHKYIKILFYLHFCSKCLRFASSCSSSLSGLFCVAQPILPSDLIGFSSNTVLFSACSYCLLVALVHCWLELPSTWHQDSMFIFDFEIFVHARCGPTSSSHGNRARGSLPLIYAHAYVNLCDFGGNFKKSGLSQLCNIENSTFASSCLEVILSRMEVNMKDVMLPGPHTRVVMFAGTVFKLKFKLRYVSLLVEVHEIVSMNLALMFDWFYFLHHAVELTFPELVSHSTQTRLFKKTLRLV